MTAQGKATIKAYFETGDKPTQAQFADLVDSYQDANSTLLQIASASNGMLVKIGDGIVAARTITGTANEIAVSAGDGINGNPTLALPSTLTLTGKTVTVTTAASATNTTQAASTAFVQQELNRTTGTWTPVLTFATPGDLNVVYSTQTGGYIKMGNLVLVNFNIATSTFTHSTASGNMQITGLPFPNNWGTANGAKGAMDGAGWTKANYTQMQATIANGTSVVNAEMTGSGQAEANLATGDLPTGGTVRMRGCVAYFTN